MTKKRGLGGERGLQALIGGLKKERQLTEALQKTPLDTIQNHNISPDEVVLADVAVDCLCAGKYQPRKNISEDSLAELSQSIARHGVMQPIVIRPLPHELQIDGVTHEIIAGERRWRAAKMAGLQKIPAICRVLSDEMAIALALIENIQREDLSVLEQAQALQRFASEFNMSHAMIAEVVGKARATVTNLLRLNALHDDVKAHVNAGHLDMGHARALLALSLQQQPIIAQKIIDEKMTTRAAEKLVQSIIHPKAKTTKSSAIKTTISRQLSDKLGAQVRIKQDKDGKGSMEILFFSHDELNSLLAQMGVEI